MDPEPEPGIWLANFMLVSSIMEVSKIWLTRGLLVKKETIVHAHFFR